jgi:DNA polymerase I-like protein with 3'-5' exonuclease and polymerase domains
MNYFIDFEFTSSSESDVDVVCVALLDGLGKESRYWMHRDDQAKIHFISKMAEIRGHTLIAYAASAECRALRSLGIDPLHYDWIDLYVEWRQLKNNNDRFKFGLVKDASGAIVQSTPYSIYSDCHQETGDSLAACALRLLKVDLDDKHKDIMRTLILSKSDFSTGWADNERNDVLDYCAADVKVLPRLLERMQLFYQRFFDQDRMEIMKRRGRYIAALSKCEHVGIPIEISTLEAISTNRQQIVADVCKSMNSDHPLYALRSDGTYVFKVDRFKEMLERLNLLGSWPRTNTGMPSIESESIESFRFHPSIEKLHQTRKTISSLRSISDESNGKLLTRIGKDHRLRSFFGPFGTQTGRNAPKAGHFVLAMSNWLRVLIRPPVGKCITGIDYSSQEFAIAASLSRDQNMMKAYCSGDPYLYFAKEAGAVPPDGTKEKYKAQRDLFKSTTLGLQYGMGGKSLSEKLTQDVGRSVPEEEARELIELHQRVFPRFWTWADECLLRYRREGALETKDGWVLFGDNPSALSVRNFLIQATGASIMRLAIILAAEADLDIVSPLHDAVYVVHDDSEHETVEKLKTCMSQAVSAFVDIDIRLDSTTFSWESPWVEAKGRADYQRFVKYLSLP